MDVHLHPFAFFEAKLLPVFSVSFAPPSLPTNSHSSGRLFLAHSGGGGSLCEVMLVGVERPSTSATRRRTCGPPPPRTSRWKHVPIRDWSTLERSKAKQGFDLLVRDTR